MGKRNTTIEIDGTTYNAATGEVIGQTAQHTAVGPAKARSIATAAARQAELDRAQRQALRAAHKTQTARKPAQHAARHAAQPTKTLMRSTVAKPEPTRKTPLKAQTPLQGAIAKPSHSLAHKVAAHSVHPRRNQLAKRVPQSTAITRFAAQTPSAVSTPAHTKQQAVHHTTRPQPVIQNHVAPIAPQAAKPQGDLFQRAINNATSHEQPVFKPASKYRHTKRVASIGGGVVATALLLTVVISQNMGDVKLQLASARAGISASMPSERPAGFRQTSITQDPGSVTMGFTSNSDQRSYTISQSTSSWDSETLRANYVAGITKSYQTVQAGGRTVFLTGNGNATWVNGGIWYKIQSNDALSNRQLIDIASSM